MTIELIDTLPEIFRCIRLERVGEDAKINARDACLLVAPLNAEGRIDGDAARAYYGACRVLRWRAGDDHEEGYLSRAFDGTWWFQFEPNASPSTDETGLQLDDGRFVAGERVVLIENGVDFLYEVACIKRL